MSYTANQQPDGIPDGFELRDDGIYLLPYSDSKGKAPIWLCSPITVIAQTVDTQNKRWGRMISAKNEAGVIHEFVMSAIEISRVPKLIDQLLDKGLHIDSSKANRTTLSKMLMDWKPAATVLLTDKLGWAENNYKTFLFADGSTMGQQKAKFAPVRPAFSLKDVCKRGNLDAWKDTVATRANGNPVLITAISLAFAGPLLRIIGRNGFGIHFKGKSSTGKTTALSVATSVWGGSDLMQTWRTTSSALEGIAASANDSFLPLDELGEVKAAAASEAFYMLANGVAKSRASPQGCTGTAASWKIVFLSTGEISVAEKLAEARIKLMEGQSVRIMDLKADGQAHGVFDDLHGEANAAAFANVLNKSAAQACGISGPTFIKKLISIDSDLPRYCRVKVAEMTSIVLNGADTTAIPYAERAAEQFALIALAGQLATMFGLTGWSKSAALQAAIEMFGIWMTSQIDPLSRQEILRRIHEFSVRHETRLQCEGGNTVKDQVGWQDKSRVMFDDNGWSEIHAGLGVRDVAKAARGFGILMAGDGDNLKAKAPNWIPNRPRLYIVQRSVLSPT